MLGPPLALCHKLFPFFWTPPLTHKWQNIFWANAEDVEQRIWFCKTSWLGYVRHVKTMSCNGSLQLVFGLFFKERNIFFSCTQRTVCGASGKVWNVFVLITREGKSDENKRPLWILIKALPSCPGLVVIPGRALTKNTKKNPSEEKEHLIFFCGLLMRFMTYSISESGTPGQSCGKRNTNTKERGHCWSAGDILFTIPRKVVSFFVTTYRETNKKGFLS